MTLGPAIARACLTLMLLALAVLLPVSIAQADHCDNDEATTTIPACQPGHFVLDQPIVDDPECDPLAGPAPADLEALADWCDPAWSTDVDVVAATYDANVASMLASIRVVLTVGFCLLALFCAATLVLTAVNR